jgi:hypothetical protein
MSNFFEKVIDVVLRPVEAWQNLKPNPFDHPLVTEHKQLQRYMWLSLLHFAGVVVLGLIVANGISSLEVNPLLKPTAGMLRDFVGPGFLVLAGLALLNMGFAVFKLWAFERKHSKK